MVLSTVAIARVKSAVRSPTKAEQSFVSGFAAVEDRLAGSGWVSRLRRAAIDSFELQGLPSRRVEEFKYTDLRERLKYAWQPALPSSPAPVPSAAHAAINSALVTALGPLAALDAHRIVFVDGQFHSQLSQLGEFGSAVEAMALAPLLQKAPGWLEGKFAADRLGRSDALTLLNTAFMSDGLMLKVKPGQTVTKPVLVVMARAGAEPTAATLRHVIAMEPGAKLTLIEAHVALPGAATAGLGNVLCDVTVGEGAALDHICCTHPGNTATHLSAIVARLGSKSSYRVFQLTSQTGLARNQLAVTLTGETATLDISGAMLARGHEHIDTTLTVDHVAPRCESRELFKCVLDDRARGVFQGKIIVQPGADKTDGKQMAKALMLSQDAEFCSKPELEIFADDVACGHGATCAELDPELMFYCRSRGIPEAQARALLIEAFIGEAIDKIADDAVRSAVLALAQSWLREEAAQSAA